MGRSARSRDELRLIVTGASGFIGGELVEAAVLQDIQVLSVVRSEARASRLHGKLFLLFEDLTARRIIRAGFESSVLVHLVGNSRDDKGCSVWESNVATTELIVKIARQARIARIVYMSGYGVTSNSSETYFRAKAEAENIIRRSGIPYVIFRSSYVLGFGDELTPYLVRELRKGEVEIPGDGSYRIQPLYIKDLREIILNAARLQGRDGFLFDLLGSVISYKGYVELLARRFAPTAIIKHCKLEMFLQRATSSADPIFTSGELAVLVCDIVGPVTQKCLGVRIRGIEETLDEWIPQLN